MAALQTVAPGVGDGLLALLGSPQIPPPESTLTALLNEIATIPNDVVIVLDDYHVLEARPVDDALAFLVEHLPPHVHLVIATRQDPALPLARWRVRGQMTELRATDLRFTPSGPPISPSISPRERCRSSRPGEMLPVQSSDGSRQMTGHSGREAMAHELGPRADPRRPIAYQIRITGQLDSGWADWFEDLAITLDGGDTLLTGPVADQAALHGLLRKVRDLGLPLVSVTPVDAITTKPDDKDRVEP